MSAKRARCLGLALVVLTALAPFASAVDAATVPSVNEDACSVPCGYIYPLLIMRMHDELNGPIPLAQDGSITLDATLRFQFDAANEGFAVPYPNDPIVVSFEFPRKPDWADIQVEPSRIEIPIQPQYLQPNTDDPNNVQAHYVYETDVTITATSLERAVLPDGLDYGKLLVFAKSTESGLYKPGYGIKEIRVAPEDPLHESDIEKADLDVRDVPPATMAPIVRTAPGVEVTLTPPAPEVPVWQPGEWTLNVLTPDDAPLDVTAVATLVDEHGRVAFTSGKQDAPNGELAFNLTLPHVGAHTLAVHVAPRTGTLGSFTPQAFAFPVTVGPTDGDAVRFPEEYTAHHHGDIKGVRGNTNAQDSTAQFEKVFPFPAFDGASGAVASITLTSDVDPEVPGLAVAVVQILDPAGQVLAQASLDPVTLSRSVQAGALPGSGYFFVRVFGSGVPNAASFDLDIDVRYSDPPVVKRTVDGVLDAVTTPVTVGFTNFTLTTPANGLAPWTPADVALDVTREGNAYASGLTYSTTVVSDANASHVAATRVAASGLRSASDGKPVTTFTPTGPGRFTALTYLEPAAGTGLAWDPLVLALPLTAGATDAETTELPTAFELKDAGTFAASAFPQWTPVAEHAVTVLPDAGAFEATASAAAGSVLARLALVDASGEVVATGESVSEDLAPGTYTLQLQAMGVGALSSTLDAALAYATPPVVENPLYAAEDAGNAGAKARIIPPIGFAGALLAAAATALVVAVARRD